MKTDKIKDKLKSGKASIGTWLQIPSSTTAEIIASLGYDWVAIDCEHGSFNSTIVLDIVRAIELGGATPFIRIAQNTSQNIKDALETGARGLILPMIESADQLKQAIDNALFPPEGRRGVGYSRASLFGYKFKEYFGNINKDLVIVAQIEHINAVNKLKDILAVPHLNAIMVGPYDLSASMGIPGKFDTPEFVSVMEKINQLAQQCKIPMGTHIVKADPNEVKQRIEQGYQFICYGVDALFLYTAGAYPLSGNS